jgi:beta-barrel assembly-enhancing protease
MPASLSSPASVYPSRAFHPELPDGRAAGELTLTAEAFRFSSGDHHVTLPFDGAELTLGGAANRLVFVSHPCQPDWSIYTSERAILRDPRLLQHPGLAGAIAQIGHKRTRNLLVTLAATALLVAIPLLLLLNLGIFTRMAARQIPVQWEEQLGKLAFTQYQLGTPLIEDERAQQLLEQLTSQLTKALPQSPYTYRFYIARDPQLNAFALPGGYIVLHSELVLQADSAAELLGVLAHEISHVTEQHGTRNIIGSAGIALLLQLLVGDSSGVLAALTSAAPFLLNQKYSRGFEREADQRGYKLLLLAGVDPAGLLSFFEKMKMADAKARGKLRESAGDAAKLLEVPEFLSTHPATDARIAALRELVATHRGPYRDLDDTFTALQVRVQAAGGSPQQTSKDAGDEDSD